MPARLKRLAVTFDLCGGITDLRDCMAQPRTTNVLFSEIWSQQGLSSDQIEQLQQCGNAGAGSHNERVGQIEQLRLGDKHHQRHKDQSADKRATNQRPRAGFFRLGDFLARLQFQYELPEAFVQEREVRLRRNKAPCYQPPKNSNPLRVGKTIPCNVE
jgi:hypothetical protein